MAGAWGWTHIHPDLLATMPAMIELMSSPSEQVLFTADGRSAPLDIYDVATWREQEWGIFDPSQASGILRRYQDLHPGTGEQEARAYLEKLQTHFGRLLIKARDFHVALEAAPMPSTVKTLLLGGDCTPTLRGLVVEREGGRWRVRRTPGEVKHPVHGVDLRRLYYGPGDGDVTKASLLGEVPASASVQEHTDLPYAVSGFVCEKHMSLVKNWTFRDNLLNFLLYKQLPISKGLPQPARNCAPRNGGHCPPSEGHRRLWPAFAIHSELPRAGVVLRGIGRTVKTSGADPRVDGL